LLIVEALVEITVVEVIGDYRLRLTFADGTVGDVDFRAASGAACSSR